MVELECNRSGNRIKKPLEIVKSHLFDNNSSIYSLKEDHFPIPCLNGNMINLNGYYNEGNDKRIQNVLQFFYENQRFDDGIYKDLKNEFCSNKSCYGKHTCSWGNPYAFKRENVHSLELEPALELLKLKRTSDGEWELERTMNHLVASIGQLNKANPFVTKRALEVLEY